MRDSRRNRGFTLLELLIAVSLLGLLFAALTGGLRFGTKAWQTSAQRLSQSDELQLVYRVLRREISRALDAPGDLLSDRQQSSFEGHRDRLSFIGGAPTQAMTPGLFHLELYLVPDEIGQALALRWERLGGSAPRTGSDNVEPILRGLRSVEFSYFGRTRNEDRGRWLSEGRDDPGLPELVRITVEFVDTTRTPWPDIVIPVFSSG